MMNLLMHLLCDTRVTRRHLEVGQIINIRSRSNLTRSLPHDVFGNLAVLLAALGVFGTGTGWPDVTVAAVMAGMVLQGSSTVIRQAVAELRQPVAVPAE